METHVTKENMKKLKYLKSKGLKIYKVFKSCPKHYAVISKEKFQSSLNKKAQLNKYYSNKENNFEKIIILCICKF